VSYARSETARVEDDDQLMVRVQHGEASAFEELYDRHARAAMRVARHVRSDLGEEAVQEGFVSVWRSRDTYDSAQGSVRGWILAIVRRRALDLVRFETHRAATTSAWRLDLKPGPGVLEHDIIAAEDARRLREMIGDLPPLQREVIVLAYFAGLTHTEIAARLRLPAGTVKGRMRLGMTKLRHDERLTDLDT
jgi:RNA polymerase sigma-70 factor (ECF subfamily)